MDQRWLFGGGIVEKQDLPIKLFIQDKSTPGVFNLVIK